MSVTGGHLSPNLGVVELTLALHRVFDSPKDRLIWDVGHQAYVHKIVTGRADRFDELRHTGGLSGYPSQEESPHDFVENSHASTALSYAAGHALAGYDGWTVAVVGDGAFTGGMAYEALNHIAVTTPQKLIIVLNDNGRSYAPTVGGLAQIAHYRIDPRYEKTKKAIGKMLRGIPVVGETADELAGRIKDAVKQIVEPTTVFDALNIKYSGVVDGHNIELLEETLEQAKTYDEPVVVHVVTEKGSGYQPAIEDEEDKLHGVGSFDIATGKALKTELKLTEVAGRALAEAAARRPDVLAISAAMISTAGLKQMGQRFPDRVFDTGIAEQHAVTLAAGMAMAGKKPVVAVYSAFLQRAFDQINADVALHNLPVTFLIDRAGVTGPDGPSHHGVFDLSYLRMIPNLVVGAPADATELCAMIETAVDPRRSYRHPLSQGRRGFSAFDTSRIARNWRCRTAQRRRRRGVGRRWPDGGDRREGSHRPHRAGRERWGDKRKVGQASRPPHCGVDIVGIPCRHLGRQRSRRRLWYRCDGGICLSRCQQSVYANWCSRPVPALWCCVRCDGVGENGSRLCGRAGSGRPGPVADKLDVSYLPGMATLPSYQRRRSESPRVSTT